MNSYENSQDNLILVTLPGGSSGIAHITINRPKSLNSLTKPMMADLAKAFKSLHYNNAVHVIILSGAGSSFCSGVDLTSAEDVFKGDVKDVETDPVAQMERCKKVIIGAISGYAITAGFEIALACDIIVAAKGAKFMDTHASDPIAQIERSKKVVIGAVSGFAVTAWLEIALACDIIVAAKRAKFMDTDIRFGIFPSWGLSQKLSRIIGPNRAREVSLTAMPLTAEQGEKWGLVNHLVEPNDLLNKAQAVAQAIVKNNQDLVLRYKAVINDGIKLDLGHALALEKERAHEYYNGMTKEQFKKMQEFIAGRSSKKPASKL